MAPNQAMGGQNDIRRWNWDIYNNVPVGDSPRQGTPLSKQSQLSQSSIEDVWLKTVETQTDYRDCETQTDPFSPLYVVPTGDAPELISLATLSWGKGLPAGLEEVQLIGRLRGKKAWEAMFKGDKNSCEFEKRQRLMIMIEANEWLSRDRQIESLHAARLEIMKKYLSHREEFNQNRMIKKLDKVWARKQKEKENTLNKIRRDHANALRKLLQRRAPGPRVSFERKVGKEYADPGSQVYAPLTRLGRFVDRNSEMYLVTSKHLSTYEGLLELESSLPEFVLNPRVTQPKRIHSTRLVARPCRNSWSFEDDVGAVDSLSEKELSRESRLSSSSIPSQFERSSKANQSMDTSAGSEASSKAEILRKSTLKHLKLSFQVNQTITRPPTPENRNSPTIDESITMALTLIQQTIRGRSAQNKMIEGKDKCRDLISEVKATVLFDKSTDQKLKQHMEYLTTVLKNNRTANEHKESTVNQILQELEGRSVGECLDFLSKELVRLEEERRIHAFSIICERQRRKRELAEGRMRQQEMRRRDEQDEILKEVMKTHQCSVDGYLDQLISNTVDQIADDQSKREMETQANSINQLAYTMEKYRDQIMSEEIAADLVHSFLIPEANKEFIRAKVRRNQRRFLMAAHCEIHEMHSIYLIETENDSTSSLSEHDRKEDKTPGLSEYDRRKDKTPGLSENDREGDKTPRLSKYDSGQDKTPRLSKYDSGQDKTPRLSKYDSGQDKTPRLSKYDSGQDKTPRLSKYDSGQDKTPRLSKYDSGQDKTPGLSKYDSGRDKTPRLSKYDSGQDKTPRLSKYDSGQDKTPRLSKYDSGQNETHRLSDQTRVKDKTNRLSKHDRGKDKTLRVPKHDRMKHKRLRVSEHDSGKDKTPSVSEHDTEED